MALDFTGIENVEFYSAHYLDAVLEGDLKQVFDKWRSDKDEHGKRPPYESLNALANRFFQTLAQAEGERDDVERWRLARDLHAHLLEALGYPYAPSAELLDAGEVCPVLAALQRDGRPFLWIVDAPFAEKEDTDPLEAQPLREQLPAGSEDEKLPDKSWRELLDERIFRVDPAPRWVLFCGGRELILIERNKWPQGKYLRFDLGKLYSRRQAAALRAMAGLLHRDVLAPDAGVCLHDTLDESSHKHAFAVSSDLKHGVRHAVELLANEAVWYRREKQKLGVFNEEELADKLTVECLTWLYRLLFLFYAEARGAELGVVPMASTAYRDGYSLEKLRDLELVPLTTEQARNGYFLHDSLRVLFGILNNGFPAGTGHTGLLAADAFHHDTFEIAALNSPLFDEQRLDVLRNVRFRNFVLQEVLQLLSLSGEKKGKLRGRISYAQLGINQLGAVYEGILSYSGFFAHEDLYEVAAADDCAKLSGKPAAEREALKAYFAPASRIGDYKDSEIVRDENGKKVVHPRGTFIFRLAGRNREKSASYYTPEVLTKCLVKYALKELLWQEAPPSPASPAGEGRGEGSTSDRKRKKTADDILGLTICEPAMGSSAFLIEAIDQLADAYLEARQEELGKKIPSEDYQREKRRVKARLATNNCYGVDLNPTAVELAKVSLWLATLHEGGKCPWFGLRLANGNSLIGTRREVFKTADVTRKGSKQNPNWLGLVPEAVPLSHGEGGPEIDGDWLPPPRPRGTIYHFLLPAQGMAAFDTDKVIKELAPESVKRIKDWRKKFCAPFDRAEAQRLEKLSDAVDRLFAQVVRERVLATEETSDRIPVWGEPRPAKGGDLLVRDQEEVQAALESKSSAYRRLKLAMDAWCALWFWPIDEAGQLPDRATWLAALELLLIGQVTKAELWEQEPLFKETASSQGRLELGKAQPESYQAPSEGAADRVQRLRELSDAFRDRRNEYLEECGLADIEAIERDVAFLEIVQQVANRLRFHHWELRFAEVFAKRDGFDLSIGNPPWQRLVFDESGFLSDFDARVEIDRLSGAAVDSVRPRILQVDPALRAYTLEYQVVVGGQRFLVARENFAVLEGQKANLYKAFLVIGWRTGAPTAMAAFVHEDGMYSDPGGGGFRAQAFPRLRYRLQFINELKLFAEVGHQKPFSLNVYRCQPTKEIRILQMSSLYHPRTVDESFLHDGKGRTPGLKTANGDWDVSPHQKRIVMIDARRLRMVADLYSEPGMPFLETSLPELFSEDVVAVIEKFAGAGVKLGALKDRFLATYMFDESKAQKDRTIRRQTTLPKSADDWIISGPHFYVGNPLNKTPNVNCSSSGDYSDIDLSSIPADYLPRTNYVPACTSREFVNRTPKWGQEEVTKFFRVANRQMMVPSNERTLISAIIPPGPRHLLSVLAVAFREKRLLCIVAGLFFSIPYDFLVKCTGKRTLDRGMLATLPVFETGGVADGIAWRAARLSALTNHYASLWEASQPWRISCGDVIASDPRIVRAYRVTSCRDSALRTDYDRRQAIIELDVLAAMAIGLSLEELSSIYLFRFPVLQQYENERLYDQHGRIVPTSKTAAGNPAVSLVELANTLKEQAGFDVHATYFPGNPELAALRHKRVRLSKRDAEVLRVPEHCTMADLLAETDVRWSDAEHPEGRPVRLVGLRYTDPGLEPRKERVYPTPWTRCDREADYRQAWAEFERRLGKAR